MTAARIGVEDAGGRAEVVANGRWSETGGYLYPSRLEQSRGGRIPPKACYALTGVILGGKNCRRRRRRRGELNPFIVLQVREANFRQLFRPTLAIPDLSKTTNVFLKFRPCPTAVEACSPEFCKEAEEEDRGKPPHVVDFEASSGKLR